MMSVVSLIIAGAAASAAITFSPEAAITSSVVHLGDVADLSALPSTLRQRAAALELVRLAQDRRRVVLDRADLVSRARALMPALAPLLPAGGASVVVLRHVGAAPLPSARGDQPGGIAKSEPVTVTVRIGSVTVTRAARAMQAGQPGGQFFVLTAEHAVLSVECCGDR